MSTDSRDEARSRTVDAVLREFVNALGKAAIYPPGHRFISESAASLIDRLNAATVDRDSITITILPDGLLVDGDAIDPLPRTFRDFAVRMHRKHIAAIQTHRGISPAEVATMLAALAASDAEEHVGREGLKLPHAVVEPMTYDALRLVDDPDAQGLDDGFWADLAIAAFEHRSASDAFVPTVAQIAEAISDRSALGPEGAQRVYDALSSFAAALSGRGQRGAAARKRFVELLASLSRPATTRVMAAAPSPESRRRFVVDALELVPATLLLQVLESVAEADGDPISAQLRTLLAKLASSDGSGEGGFAIQVLGLVGQWNGGSELVDESVDPHTGVDPARLVGTGLELAVASPAVLTAAAALVANNQLADLLRLLDDSRNDRGVARAVGGALTPATLEVLLAASPPDFAVVERVATWVGGSAVDQLLDALGAATERTTRRRLLDILVRIGPGVEATLLARLAGAEWYLARNILAVLAQFDAITNVEPVFAELAQPEVRVRQEALKVLLRQATARDRAVERALADGDESLVRMSLTALGSDCPAKLVPSVSAVLSRSEPELQLLAIRALAGSGNPQVQPRLMAIVASRRGLFRRLRLQPKSPVMLAALEVLARRWARDGAVAGIIALAARSTDAEIRAAVGRVA